MKSLYIPELTGIIQQGSMASKYITGFKGKNISDVFYLSNELLAENNLLSQKYEDLKMKRHANLLLLFFGRGK